METIASDYGHAIVSLAMVAVMALFLGPASGRAKSLAGLAAGAIPEADYANRTYRLHRAAQNMTEFLPIFGAVVAMAILAGVSPFWTNLLASAILLSRVAHLVLHVGGVGAMNTGPRSFAFIIGWLACLALAVMTIIRVAMS